MLFFAASSEVISDVVLMVGPHTIAFEPATLTPDSSGIWMPHWVNRVKIDGISIAPAIGVTTLASWSEGTVEATINTMDYLKVPDWENAPAASAFAGPKANKITITTPQYTIAVGTDNNTGGLFWITIVANDAGVCGLPGGLFGKSLDGVAGDDLTISNYKLPTATSKAAEFNRTPCPVRSAERVRLVQ